MKTQESFIIAPVVQHALQEKRPIVALETAVVTHGLPRPVNHELAIHMEAKVREEGAIPATIGVVKGNVYVGLSKEQIDFLANTDDLMKISHRDFAPAHAFQKSGGTTVAGSIIMSHLAGIKVFATGGIGGVHRGSHFDISTDLIELSRRPVVVVCAGAKAILDLPATVEYLETMGVSVVGYQTDEFPAFFTRESGLPVSVRANSPEKVWEIAQAHWSLGLTSAILVVVPPPADSALDAKQVEGAINQALQEVNERGIQGQSVTPYLLRRVSEITGKASLRANIELLLNNASVASRIACAFKPKIQTVEI
ncbi:MAG: pseudouridine-5'-phosphate glycosidase [Anaerolineales bacterium]|nr:pseudouridine-5'-phosphate glycosidase [Anaerolineales bacterium]